MLAVLTLATATSFSSLYAWFVRQPAGEAARLCDLANAQRSVQRRAAPDRLRPLPGGVFFRGGVEQSLGGFYDPRHHLAVVFLADDAGSDRYVTRVTSPPPGLPVHLPASEATTRGVTLGMPVSEVQRIEGPGTTIVQRDDLLLEYAWEGPPNCQGCSGDAGLAYLFRHGKLVVIDDFTAY